MRIRKPSDLTPSQFAALTSAANQIGIPSDWLFALIKTESGFDPLVKNPYASARGLIQWVDSTSQQLGYKDTNDLIAKNPTIETQLLGPVVQYLKKWGKIISPEDLAAVNFYPIYRGSKVDTLLPEKVRKVNPGVNTVRDYYEKYMAKNMPGYIAKKV
jgi:hypothetical protein